MCFFTNVAMLLIGITFIREALLRYFVVMVSVVVFFGLYRRFVYLWRKEGEVIAENMRL